MLHEFFAPMSIDSPAKEVTTYYLEMKSPDQLSGNDASVGLHVVEAIVKQYQFNRFLYELVGAPWAWTDKLQWSDGEWRSYAENANLRTWVAYSRGSPAGYFELQQQDLGDVEIVYLGLADTFIGCGFGAYLLTQAVRSAWAWRGTKRVWVHTCTLDHPAALHNYQARGFRIYKKDVQPSRTAFDR